jgi:hypothetical protein
MGLKLGDFSPLAGAVTGEGLFGEYTRGLGIKYPGADAAKKKIKDEKDAADKAEKAANSVAPVGLKRGGTVKKMAKGGSVSSASKRADGCATKGKTKGRFV